MCSQPYRFGNVTTLQADTETSHCVDAPRLIEGRIAPRRSRPAVACWRAAVRCIASLIEVVRAYVK